MRFRCQRSKQRLEREPLFRASIESWERFPSSIPGVIANGGTKLTIASCGSIAKETVWNELRYKQGATGGGVSEVNKKPPLQAQLPITGRGFPDIAGDVDPTTGFRILVPLGEGDAGLEVAEAPAL
jgi:subtilase family serine protease